MELTQQNTESDEELIAERLTFGWWNTSLSPVGKVRADDAHKAVSAKIVKSLIDDLKVDFLALGEVTNADLVALKESCENQNLDTFDGTLKTGRLQFDTGIIYDASRLIIENSESITTAHGNRNLKVANRVNLRCVLDGSSFTAFVSHWPSRAANEGNSHPRTTIADRLKQKIEAANVATVASPVIVLGDFNDEPFDDSMSWHLLATRDRRLARTGAGYLYNPFWRHLGESEPHTHLGANCGAAGSCFYRAGTDTQWRTFDQILFSPTFLGEGDWHLDETKTLILRTEYLVELVQSGKVHFDHLPVLSVIEKLKP